MTAVWSAYEYQPSFLLGFHGCEEEVGERVLRGQESHLTPSGGNYDWLGSGVYFWEGSPSRALAWAAEKRRGSTITKPFVLGAIIDLRHCLDLFDLEGLAEVKRAHNELSTAARSQGKPLPSNIGATPDKAERALDCLVMNTLHYYRQVCNAPEYDSVRAPFIEGEPLYEGAGFRTRNHIQICVRNAACIKGYFRPLEAVPAESSPPVL